MAIESWLPTVLLGIYGLVAVWRIAAAIGVQRASQRAARHDGEPSADDLQASEAIVRETAREALVLDECHAFATQLRALRQQFQSAKVLEPLLLRLDHTGHQLETVLTPLMNSPILENESLRVPSYFNGKLTAQFMRVNEQVRNSNYEAALEQLDLVDQYLATLDRFREHWETVRLSATRGILVPDELQGFEENFDELRHSRTKVIQDEDGVEYGWNTWRGLVAPADQMNTLAEMVAQLLQYNGITADVAYSMSVSGAPFAHRLSTLLGLKHHAVDNRTYGYLPEPPRRDAKYILVDSMIRTGEHLQRTIQNIESEGGEVVKAVFVVFNDMLPPDDNRRYVADNPRFRGTPMFLYRVSEILRLHRDGARLQ